MIKDRNLHRFWFEFERDRGLSSRLFFGCGVTAYNKDDALLLIAKQIYENSEMPKIVRVIEDVDISELDQGHVVPNMEAPIWRGIWFPKGLSSAH
jgi:hypothetical protein